MVPIHSCVGTPTGPLSVPAYLNTLRSGLKIGHCEGDSAHAGGGPFVMAYVRDELWSVSVLMPGELTRISALALRENSWS